MVRVHQYKERIRRAATIEAWVVLAVIVATIWFLQSNVLADLVEKGSGLGPLSGFLTGLLYSTFVTTPLAIGGFIVLADTMPTWQIAMTGALGATVVDLALTRGIRSPLSVLLVQAVVGHDIHMFRRMRGPLRWGAGLFGALLIAIPLPTDELGVVFLGASHLQPLRLMALIFLADLIGIYGFLEVLHALD